MGVRYPLGRVCGRAFNADEQRQIIGDALDAAMRMTRSGELIELPNRWPEEAA